MDYKNKYLKYKNKYLELQNKQIGGAFPFRFGDGNILYIMAKISGDTLDRVNERRKAFKLEDNTDLHISMLQIYLNNKHPLYTRIFINDDFEHAIIKSYDDNILKNNVILTSINPLTQRGNWGLLGRNPNKYWARIYDFDGYENNIKQFRLDIYKYIESISGKLIKSEERRSNSMDPTDIDDFVIYKTQDGNELYAIHKKFYFGVDNWNPHISILTIPELEQSSDRTVSDKMDQNSVISKFNARQTDDDKIKVLRIESGNRIQINPISNINLNRDVNELKFSINDIKQKRNIEKYLSVKSMQPSVNDLCTIM